MTTDTDGTSQPDEVVAGEVIAIQRSVAQQRLCYRLHEVLRTTIDPGFAPVMAAGWRVRESPLVVRTPDVMVIPSAAYEGDVFVETPLLVVEVMTPERRVQVVRKGAEYASAGLPRLWLIDSAATTLAALYLRAGLWHQDGSLTSGRPKAVLDTGAGEIEIDLLELFRGV